MWILLIVIMLASCGADELAGAPVRDVTPGVSGAQVIVKAVGPASAHPLARVQQFRVVVTGDDFAPIEASFDGQALEGELVGIPPGSARHLRVEAVNAAEQIIRDGEVADVEIPDGERTEIPVTLEVLPIFTNLREGGVVSNTRLRPEILTTPGHAVQVQYGSAGGTDAAPLLDVALGTDQLTADVTLGTARLAPALLAVGAYRLAAVDLTSGRRTELQVRVTDGTQRRGAPLFVGGRIGPQAVLVSGFGAQAE